MVWIDEIFRAGFGFLASLPVLSWCRRRQLSAIRAGLVLTVYIVFVWRAYAWVTGVLR